MYSPFFHLQNAVCLINLTYLVPLLFTFYIQGVLKLKKNNSGTKRLTTIIGGAYIYFPKTYSNKIALQRLCITDVHIIVKMYYKMTI